MYINEGDHSHSNHEDPIGDKIDGVITEVCSAKLFTWL